MLDFYLADVRTQKPDESKMVGRLSLEDCQWLTKFGFVREGLFSFFESSWISPKDAQAAFLILLQRQAERQQTPGFSGLAIERLKKILTSAVECGSGLATLSD